MQKYRNKITVVDGLKFDSKKEGARWQELKLLERAGKIEHLERQIKIQLAPSVKFEGEKRAKPALVSILDFRYLEDGLIVYEDTKSSATITTAFQIKRHLLKALCNIDVRLTK